MLALDTCYVEYILDHCFSHLSCERLESNDFHLWPKGTLNVDVDDRPSGTTSRAELVPTHN